MQFEQNTIPSRDRRAFDPMLVAIELILHLFVGERLSLAVIPHVAPGRDGVCREFCGFAFFDVLVELAPKFDPLPPRSTW